MSEVRNRLIDARSTIAQKEQCRVATTANITLRGWQTIDGVALSVHDVNLRVLVKNQTDARENGIYTAKSGDWVRTSDFNNNNNLLHGAKVYVGGGSTAFGDYQLTTADPVRLDESLISWEIVGGTGVDLLAANNLADLTNVGTARTNLVVYSQSEVDALVAAADTALRGDLAATTAAHGASLVGIQDVAGLFTATTVEGALAEVHAAKQPLDSDLTAVAAFGSTGFAVRTGAGAWTPRSFANAAAGITWTNADGVSGNPTPVLANDLAALEGLGSTGIAVRSASDTWVQRSIAGTANEITISNGDGVSGNPTASLPSSLTFTGKTITGGTFASPAAITGLPDPTSAQDAATKNYVDTVAQGLDAKTSVKCATTANITLSGEQTLDGILTSASRVLVKSQSTASQNGIYVSAAGAWSRATDFDAWTEVPGAFVFVEEGTTLGDTGWVCTSNTGGTIGSTSVVWTQFSGAGSYTAGTGLSLSGTQFSIDSTVVTLVGSQTLTNKTLTSPTINTPTIAGGTHTGITSLGFRSTGAAFDVTFASSEVLTAGRTVTWVLGDAARTITLSGNPTLNDWFNQSVKTTANPQFATIELGAASDTTISRVSAGVIAVEGSNVILASNLATNVLAFLATPSSANFAAALTDENGTGAVVLTSAIREKLSAARTYYVRTDGNDSNTGLVDSSGGAFLTIQAAVNAVAVLDIGGQTVTIQVRDGTYTGAVTLKNCAGFAAPGNLVIIGNSVTPANVIISTTSANCFTADNLFVTWDLNYMKLQTTTSGNCIDSTRASIRYIGLNFGASSGGNHVSAVTGSFVTATGDYTVSGAAIYHIYCTTSSIYYARSITVTLSGTPAVSGQYLAAFFSSTVTYQGITFSGTATGTRYTAVYNAVIYTGSAGATYLPGNAAGSTSQGGVYD